MEDQLRRDWSQSEQAKIEVIRYISTSEHALWAAAICQARISIEGTEYLFEHLRGTLTIEKEDGVWKIAHMHCSFPDYRNAANGSFPLNNQ